VVLATGSRFRSDGFSAATPSRSAIPGAELTHVIDPVEALDALEHCAAEVLVFDDVGDYVAGGLALLLARSGRSVELATRHLFVGAGSGLHQSHDLPWLLRQLSAEGVTVITQSSLTEIRPETAVLTDVWSGRQRITPAGTVVINAVRSSDHMLIDGLTDRGVFAHRIGDCLAPREVDDAIYDGMACAQML